MKRLIFLIAVMAIASISNLSATRTAMSGSSINLKIVDLTASTVLIEHTWQQMYGGKLYDVSAYSLGTVIGRDLILTHHHFNQPLGRLPEEIFIFEDAAGRTIRWRPGDLKWTVSNSGTTLIRLPTVTFPTSVRTADAATLQRLTVGVWLTVSCRDNRTGGLAQQSFQISQIKDNIVKLADPDWLINSGDSGGGAFLDNQLVGNTWSIDMDRAGNPLGAFNVALVSSG